MVLKCGVCVCYRDMCLSQQWLADRINFKQSVHHRCVDVCRCLYACGLVERRNGETEKELTLGAQQGGGNNYGGAILNWCRGKIDR